MHGLHEIKQQQTYSLRRDYIDQLLWKKRAKIMTPGKLARDRSEAKTCDAQNLYTSLFRLLQAGSAAGEVSEAVVERLKDIRYLSAAKEVVDPVIFEVFIEESFLQLLSEVLLLPEQGPKTPVAVIHAKIEASWICINLLTCTEKLHYKAISDSSLVKSMIALLSSTSSTGIIKDLFLGLHNFVAENHQARDYLMALNIEATFEDLLKRLFVDLGVLDSEVLEGFLKFVSAFLWILPRVHLSKVAATHQIPYIVNFFISNAFSVSNSLDYFPSFLRYLENCSEEEIGFFNSSMFGNKLISEVLAKFPDERSTVLVLNMLSELVRGTNSTVVAQVPST